MRKVFALFAFAMMSAALYAAQGSSFVWGSADVRYPFDKTPAAEKAPEVKVWKGERFNVQAVFSAAEEDVDLSVAVSDFKSGRNVIPSSCACACFVDYVIVDDFGRIGENVSLQPDRLVNAPKFKVKAGQSCPIWITVSVPQDVVAGRYSGTVRVSFSGQTQTLPLTFTVTGRTLPSPDKWKFHLDLWQNPYAVARYFNVPLWSKEHFDAMRPIYERYAAAGGKVITASIIQHPWNSQTYDPFESMVAKTKHLDGTWSYDYSVFDKWIEFMMSCGITEQIDCYTIVPWGYTFEYFDLASSTVKHIDCVPGDQAYEDYILPFLTDFAVHLKARGWFDRTCIAMDERPMDQLKAARKIVRMADPAFRIAGAVNYSPEVVDIMHDISIGYSYSDFPQDVILQRSAEGHFTTIYTCCGPEHPNTFTFSPYAEAEYIGLSSATRHYDGYLRWALNSWPEDPCHDSRFSKWVSGDTYLLYPEGSSVRFERLVEGIQDYEKIRILREEGNPKVSSRLDEILAPFNNVVCDETIDAAATVRKAKNEINKL